jgi:hypothetical protein
MLDSPTLAKALVGAEASNSVATVKYREPSASESRVASVIADEVGRIEAKLSIMLAHVEGNYESQVANLKLKLVAARWYWETLAAVAVAFSALGFVIGRI